MNCWFGVFMYFLVLGFHAILCVFSVSSCRFSCMFVPVSCHLSLLSSDVLCVFYVSMCNLFIDFHAISLPVQFRSFLVIQCFLIVCFPPCLSVRNYVQLCVFRMLIWSMRIYVSICLSVSGVVFPSVVFSVASEFFCNSKRCGFKPFATCWWEFCVCVSCVCLVSFSFFMNFSWFFRPGIMCVFLFRVVRFM